MSLGERIKEWIRREFPLYLGLATVATNFLVGFNLEGLSGEHAALWIGLINVVAGTIVALLTRPVAPTVFVYLLSSGVAVAAAYGYNVPPETVAQWSALVQGVMVFLLRNQISPNKDAPFTGVLGGEPP